MYDSTGHVTKGEKNHDNSKRNSSIHIRFNVLRISCFEGLDVRAYVKNKKSTHRKHITKGCRMTDDENYIAGYNAAINDALKEANKVYYKYQYTLLTGIIGSIFRYLYSNINKLLKR